MKPADEFDEASDAFVQARAAVATALLRKGDPAPLVRLELGQDVDVKSGRAADSFGQLAVNPRYFRLTSAVRWDWERRLISAVAAALRFDDSRGDSVELRYDRLLEGGTGRTRSLLDSLFATTTSSGELAFNQVTLSLLVTIVQGISIRYGAAMVPDMPEPFFRRIIQHTGGVSLSTSCDCWRLDAYVTYVRNSGASFGFLIDLKSLGSFGR